ncbi:MAG: glutamyl-tRNA reductase [Gammaproteobacteria bacterium]|nr:glutamyl-tRNA reductase [Gammaproteobacteria bacterium]
MHLTVLGINHTTAPVEVRGKVVFPPEQLDNALTELTALEGVYEAVILSTCNRTELYCTQKDREFDPITDWLCQFHNLCQGSLNDHIYIHTDEAAVRHALRVAAGLDSMILGEPQILGQMKASYQIALDAGSIHTLMNRLFQHTFSVAKQIRTDTAIGASPVSVAFAAVRLAMQIFGSLEKQTALLIGAGETIELTARHLHEQGTGKIIIANRTVERAHDLAAHFDGYGIGLDEISAHLPEADIVISSTGSTGSILDRETVVTALKGRRHRPVFMVDLAVPPDIAADVAELDDVYLYNVDDLKLVIEENLRSRQEAAKQAEEIIEVQVTHFSTWTQSLEAVPTLRAYREHAQALGKEVLDKANQQLDKGTPPKEVVETLTRNLINKLTHDPSVNLRSAVAGGNTGLLDAVRTLFHIKDKK